MLELASHYRQERMRASEISENQGISLKYLESLLATLKAAGLITSEKGRHGGYSLAKAPGDITLLDVLTPLEDSLAIVECAGAPTDCEHVEVCVTREVWVRLREATGRILRETTLADLLVRKAVLQKGGRQVLPCREEVAS